MKNELTQKRNKLLDRKIELETELAQLSKDFNKKYKVVSKHLTMVKKELERI